MARFDRDCGRSCLPYVSGVCPPSESEIYTEGLTLTWTVRSLCSPVVVVVTALDKV